MSWIAAGVPGGMDEGRISGIRKVWLQTFRDTVCFWFYL
jgi:hypothetical protein